jgi:ABC-type molybdate transport system substrate-binding protein
MFNYLTWPAEPEIDSPSDRWQHAASNICLDFHGDPCTAQLVVFSDGNHHMALADTITRFKQRHPNVTEIFYATTPPGVLLDIIQNGRIVLGNLAMSVQPHVFISPELILQKLVKSGAASAYHPFMKSKGNVMLVKRDNPRNIQSVHDLLREDVRLFISNPDTEKASYQVYKNTLDAIAQHLNIAKEKIQQRLDVNNKNTVFGERIHHRELPQAIYSGHADVAVVYYHLALRYTRIFPEHFSFIPLLGEDSDPEQEFGNEQTTYHITTMNQPGIYGTAFLDFCKSPEVAEIYQHHGLQRPN